MLSGVICHFLSQKETTIGRKDAKPVPSICLSGLRLVSKVIGYFPFIKPVPINVLVN